MNRPEISKTKKRLHEVKEKNESLSMKAKQFSSFWHISTTFFPFSSYIVISRWNPIILNIRFFLIFPYVFTFFFIRMPHSFLYIQTFCLHEHLLRVYSIRFYFIPTKRYTKLFFLFSQVNFP